MIVRWMQIAAMSVLAAFISVGGVQAAAAAGGFTGPDVPALTPMMADYANIGVKTSPGRTDVPQLLGVLQEIHATDYMHLVWREDYYPSAWDDFQLMAPQFQQAGIRLWLYLTPPSEGVPDPFQGDYVRWATETAAIAAQYSTVAGIVIDDFDYNTALFTPSYTQQMMDAAHAVAPELSLLVTVKYAARNTIAEHVRAGAVDGVVAPYYPGDHTDTTQFLPEMQSYRTWLDTQTALGGQSGAMPLVPMIYATKHSGTTDVPTPVYVEKLLDIGLEATTNGLANGVVTYCLPKDQPSMVEAVARVYAANAPQGVVFNYDFSRCVAGPLNGQDGWAKAFGGAEQNIIAAGVNGWAGKHVQAAASANPFNSYSLRTNNDDWSFSLVDDKDFDVSVLILVKGEKYGVFAGLYDIDNGGQGLLMGVYGGRKVDGAAAPSLGWSIDGVAYYDVPVDNVNTDSIFRVGVAVASDGSGNYSARRYYKNVTVGGEIVFVGDTIPLIYEDLGAMWNQLQVRTLLSGSRIDNIRVSQVPEPSTAALLSAGLAGLLLCRARRNILFPFCVAVMSQ